MSTYNLSQTAAEIDSAIGKVHNADTAPTQGSTSMVTSGGVFDAVNNIGISALPITTEAQGIANYDTNDKVPTNAAVKDYVDSRPTASNLIVATKASQSSTNTFYVTGYTITGSNVTEGSNGLLTITGSGIWAVSVNGWVDTSDSSDDWYGSLYVDESQRILGSTTSISDSDQALSGLTFVDSSGSFTVQVRISERVAGATGYINNLRVEAIKLS